eukprot:31267-Pelagococcus_subviridis.AAC.10
MFRQHLDALRRLEDAHHPRDGAEHAAARARRAVPRRRRRGKHAPRRDRFLFTRVRGDAADALRARAAVHRELPFGPDGGGGDQRHPRGGARVRDHVPRLHVVRAVEHDVVAADQVERVRGREPRLDRPHVASRVHRAQGCGRGGDLREPDRGLAMRDLTMDVRQLDDVRVRERDAPEPARDEVHRRGRAEAAEADDQNPCAMQRRLLERAEGRERDVPRVSRRVRRGERARPSRGGG